MQVEHITLTENTLIQDTDSIGIHIVETLKSFQITEGEKTCKLRGTNLNVKLVVNETGAMVNIYKSDNNQPAYINFYCFEEKKSKSMLAMVNVFVDRTKTQEEARTPVLSNWIYTVPGNCQTFTKDETMMCADITFFLYHSLLLARYSRKE